MKIKYKILIYAFASIFFLTAGGSVLLASTSVGTIDAASKSAIICKNTTCSSFGNVNFAPTLSASTTGASAVSIADAGLTGYIWGDEIGWVNLSPTNGGVTINPSTGALGGTAYSSVGGWINFSPTNGGVTLVDNGIGSDFSGFAYVSGLNGGWMKFDCSATSTCVKTDWRTTSNRGGTTSSGGGGGGPTEDYECGNGLDDDKNGLIDYPDDPGCSKLRDSDESGAPVSVTIVNFSSNILLSNIADTSGVVTITTNPATKVALSYGGNSVSSDTEKNTHTFYLTGLTPSTSYTLNATFTAGGNKVGGTVSKSFNTLSKAAEELIKQTVPPIPLIPIARDAIVVNGRGVVLSSPANQRSQDSQTSQNYESSNAAPDENQNINVSENLENDSNKENSAVQSEQNADEIFGKQVEKVEIDIFSLPKNIPAFFTAGGEVGIEKDEDGLYNVPAGYTLSLVVVPESEQGEPKEVFAILEFKKSDTRIREAKGATSGFWDRMLRSFGVNFAEGAEVESQRIVYEKNADGSYRLDFKAPQSPGIYELKTTIDYGGDNKETSLSLVVAETLGEIFSKSLLGQDYPVKNAVVELFVKSASDDSYELFHSIERINDNPKKLGGDGVYSFIVPKGDYKLLISAPGYKDFSLARIKVSKSGRLINERVELACSFWSKASCMWPIKILTLLMLIFIVLYYRSGKNYH